MKFKNVYFINGNAYAGKSTMIKLLAEKYNGIACCENYHDELIDEVNETDFPALSYTKYMKDWRNFIRRTPDEYEAWINACSKECEFFELKILNNLINENKPIFVDTNISLETLSKISDKDHVLIMLADPSISVTRFFERPDKEKQFLYQLLLQEDNPQEALQNFRLCLERINSIENYNYFLNYGFNVLIIDDNRTIEETLILVEKSLKLQKE